MTEQEKKEKTLIQAQSLYQVIESHPYLSGLMTDALKQRLTDVIRNAHYLDDVDSFEWQKTPDEELLDKYC